MIKKFRSNGKLLLTGEYVVLDGALALALPAKFGQSLEVATAEGNLTTWTALDHLGKPWLELKFLFEENRFITQNDTSLKESEKRLIQILEAAHEINPGIFALENAYTVTTMLDFNQAWGLGSSSTLINNIAAWFEINPYQLLEKTFGGSGYDIAAAQANRPVTYQLQENGRSVLNSNFDPIFKDHLFFIYLNKKQNSRSSIAHYKQQSRENLLEAINKISALTASVITCETIAEFELLLEIHETIISQTISMPKIKTQLFPDFKGGIKSLGGWGGDFILATGGDEAKDYFRRKGYGVIIPYSEMVL